MGGRYYNIITPLFFLKFEFPLSEIQKVKNMKSMRLYSIIQIIAILEHSEEFKIKLKRDYRSCEIHKDYCQCLEGEMCNTAIAEVLNCTASTSWKKLNNILRELGDCGFIRDRIVDNPRNRPRKLYCLKTNWRELLDFLVEEEYNKLCSIK